MVYPLKFRLDIYRPKIYGIGTSHLKSVPDMASDSRSSQNVQMLFPSTNMPPRIVRTDFELSKNEMFADEIHNSWKIQPLNSIQFPMSLERFICISLLKNPSCIP